MKLYDVYNWGSKRRETFEEIMLQKFPNLIKNINPQIQAVQKTTNRKEILSKHKTIKPPKNKKRGNIKSNQDKERELKSNRCLLSILPELGPRVYQAT